MQPAAVRASASNGLFESRGPFFFLYFRKQNYFFCKCNTTVVYFITSVVTAPFSFSSQIANHCRQQNTNLSLAVLTPSECIVWLTIFGIEAAAMVALNTVETIIYMKERSLLKRDKYLVINQAVADMSVSGFVIIRCWFLGSR